MFSKPAIDGVGVATAGSGSGISIAVVTDTMVGSGVKVGSIAEVVEGRVELEFVGLTKVIGDAIFCASPVVIGCRPQPHSAKNSSARLPQGLCCIVAIIPPVIAILRSSY